MGSRGLFVRKDTVDGLAMLLAKDAIRELACEYSLAVDDHDIESVLDMFTADATFTVAGRTLGRQELRAFYVDSMTRYTTMLHTPEIHIVAVAVDGLSATGKMTGHAELAVHDTVMMSAFRYADRYSLVDGRWFFASRHVQFMYAVPFESMAASFRTNKRIRWPQTRYSAADYPESAPTWTTFSD